MTGAEFAAAGHALALAYARLRGAAWLEAWLADNRAAADELMEWELEGHPWSGWQPATRRPSMITTAADAIAAMIELYSKPGTWVREGEAWNTAGCEVSGDSLEAVAWSLEGALYRVVGDPDADGIDEAEWRRREALASAVLKPAAWTSWPSTTLPDARTRWSLCCELAETASRERGRLR